MSNYTKITDFSQKDVVQALIEGVDFDNEFSAVSEMSTTKTDKVVPATADSLAGLTSAGNIYDTTLVVSDVQASLERQDIVGALIPYAGSSPPSGYLFSDGSSYLTASYAELFALIGYTYGGSGANFNVPDTRGRTLISRDNMGGTSANVVTNSQADSLAGILGEENHELTGDENGLHTHGVTDPGHVHSGGTTVGGDQGGGGSAARDPANTGTATTGITIQNSGLGDPHNNMQPTLVINYIIKT